VRSSPLGTSATIWPIVPALDDDECGAVGGMVGKGNRSTRRKPAPVPLCPPQLAHDLSWARTCIAAVGSQRLIAWAMSQPKKSTVTLIKPIRQECKEHRSCKRTFVFYILAPIEIDLSSRIRLFEVMKSVSWTEGTFLCLDHWTCFLFHLIDSVELKLIIISYMPLIICHHFQVSPLVGTFLLSLFWPVSNRRGA
jgi:hypothetical protein